MKLDNKIIQTIELYIIIETHVFNKLYFFIVALEETFAV